MHRLSEILFGMNKSTITVVVSLVTLHRGMHVDGSPLTGRDGLHL